MIVDCYTHVWDSAAQLGHSFPSNGKAMGPLGGVSTPVNAGIARHLAASHPVTTTFVVGFTSRYLEADIPNDRLSAYVKDHPDRLVGFAGIDPSRPRTAIAEMRRAAQELGMKGLSVAPAAQDFHPTSSHAMRVYAEAAELGLPMIFHTGVHLNAAAKLAYAQPLLLDEVARECATLKIVIAHLGYPWVAETLVLLRKHANVFAEISWILPQPWEAYQALLGAHQHGVMEKLLFGSGFPLGAASQCIEALYSINHLCSGTSLPTIPREALRGIVERDALGLLGIRPPATGLATPTSREDDGELLA